MSDATDSTTGTAHAFSGSYERAVDPKGRFNLPFRHRRKGKGKAQRDAYKVTLGVEGYLSVYPLEIWDEVFQTARANATTAEEQALIRHLSANTYDLVPDKQGRVMVPVHLLASVGIDKKVYVVGYGDHLALRHTDVYTAH